MKDPVILPIDACIERLGDFDAVLDARSPAEYAEDHLPGAQSAPVLDDEERARVGTLYKQGSPFEAKRVGAAIVARNIADLLDQRFASHGREWSPLVYCWRGGNRSGALATVLARVGWRTAVLEGGYREYRRRVVADLAAWPSRLRFVVLAGRTGSGKSLLLERLASAGAQVLDLERLAEHRGSLLGELPGRAQPSQKRFESLVWQALRGFDPARPIYVESESKKIGQRQVPDALIAAMRAAPCVRIETDDTLRSRLLLAEYRHYVEQPGALFAQLDCLVPLHGRERIARWRGLAEAGDWSAFVVALLHEHYDPAYDRSMQRNFRGIGEAPAVSLEGADERAIATAVARLRDAAGERRANGEPGSDGEP